MRDSLTATSGRSPISSLMVFVPQSKAATGSPIDAGTFRPPLPERLEDLVAEGVHARARRQGVGGQHVEALHAVGHAAGRDAVDLGYVAQLGAVGEVGAVRRGVRRCQHLVVAEA